MKVLQLTSGPKHHLFGFHDLAMTNRAGQALALAVDHIDRPPLGNDQADVVCFDPKADSFEPVTLTQTPNFNFPQGARLHWLAGGDVAVINKTEEDASPYVSLFDTQQGQEVGRVTGAIHCSDSQGVWGYGLDYGRLHRLGGYGHASVKDQTPTSVAPADNGLFRVNIPANETDLLVSIRELAQKARSLSFDTDQFVTHPRLSPNEQRIAFLHRFRLPDNGEETVLWTIDADGSDLRLLIRGFLSHFEWLDDGTLMIWGRRGQGLAAARRHPLLSNPLVRAVLPLVKAPLRLMMARSSVMSLSYLKVPDTAEPEITPYAPELLRQDGHPMLSPGAKDWLVTDTYPDEVGIRELMLFNTARQQRIDLGTFGKLDAVPCDDVVKEVTEHIAQGVDVDFDPVLYAFTRSGLHCDLHPRWFLDASHVVFDSTHEGSRQIYAIDTRELMS